MIIIAFAFILITMAMITTAAISKLNTTAVFHKIINDKMSFFPPLFLTLEISDSNSVNGKYSEFGC